MKESILFKPLKDNFIQCQICQRECKIPPGETGYCKTRKNENGKLYSIVYGQVSSIRVSPIEIKPLFHFYPGSRWLSLGSLGCNFLCPGCQNWEIAHALVEDSIHDTQFIPPEKLVHLALEQNCKGISWTYNEPTLWLEYTLETATIAKKKGLLTNYVTNGFITPDALDLIGPYMDAYRVDLKGFSPKTYQKIANTQKLDGILEIIKRASKKWNMHLEIITNLIPGINTDEHELQGMARWIVDNLGEDTPWHITRFFPYLKLSHLSSTPLSVLERARKIGIEEGLRYVYLGNVPGHRAENTYCPSCGNLLIERMNYTILTYNLKANRCSFCNHVISGHFENSQ